MKRLSQFSQVLWEVWGWRTKTFDWHTLGVFPDSHELAWVKRFPSPVSVSGWWRAHSSCSSGAQGKWSAFFLPLCASQRHAETERSWTKSDLNFRELQLGSNSLAQNVTFIKAVHFLIYQGALAQQVFKSRWSQSVGPKDVPLCLHYAVFSKSLCLLLSCAVIPTCLLLPVEGRLR